MLGAPFVFDQLDGQPVEQLGMRGLGADFAKVIEARDNPPAEMMFPNAVHPHPRGERMIRLRDPARQRQPIARLVFAHHFRRLKRLPRKHPRHSRPNQRPRVAGIAAQVHISRRGFPTIPQRANEWHGFFLRLQFIDFLFQLLALLPFDFLEFSSNGLSSSSIFALRASTTPRSFGNITSRCRRVLPAH